ncbi:MAG: hypothetical protein PHU06_04535 [Gallionella sp.]|nr:hypothetical protein [Gallionella sp.]MDD4957947.1 hypothetical protein [Gallionella sp.]
MGNFAAMDVATGGVGTTLEAGLGNIVGAAVMDETGAAEAGVGNSITTGGGMTGATATTPE